MGMRANWLGKEQSSHWAAGRAANLVDTGEGRVTRELMEGMRAMEAEMASLRGDETIMQCGCQRNEG